MKPVHLLILLVAALPALAQAPPPPTSLQLVEPPSRKKPYVIEDKMTSTLGAPALVGAAANAQGMGALAADGLASGQGSGGKKGAQADLSGAMQSHRTYTLNVAPHTRLKVLLKTKRLRNFRLRFISADFGRTEDPGLLPNRILHRDDMALYDNRTDQVKVIHCDLQGVEPMTDEPYALIFTDY